MSSTASEPVNEKVATNQVEDNLAAPPSEHGIHVVKRVHKDGTVDLIDAHAVGGDFDEMPAGYYLTPNFIFTFIAVCLANNCAYLGWVVPANTLALINEDVGPSVNISWVATGWTLGSAVGFLLFGRLTDIFGRKWGVQFCQILALVGVIVAATAHNVGALIAAETMIGIAAAGQLSFGIVVGELVPNRLRGPAVTVIFLAALPFAVFGPSIGRAFIDNTAAGWRWSYYIGIICNALALIFYQFFYHPPKYDQLHVHGKTIAQQLKEFDYVGLVLYLAGVVILLIGLSWGGQAYPWSSAHVIATLVVGIATLILFGFYEGYLAHKVSKGVPLMPPRIFKDIGYTAIVVCATIGAMVYYALTVLWPTILSQYTTDSTKIGLQSSVVGGGILLGQAFGGFALSYVPKVKWQIVITSFIGASFVASLASINADTHAQCIILGIMATVFIGYVDNITFPAVTLVFEAQDIGLATGVLGSIRAVGGAVAQALYVSILTTKAAKFIPEYVTPAVTAAGLPESSLPTFFAGLTSGNFSSVPGATPNIIAIGATETRRAYFEAFHYVFYATIPFGALLFAAAFFVPNMEKFLTNNVGKRLQRMGTKDGEAREGQDISIVEKTL
ncbi:uncharacterized protein PV09_01374 [Verruconis gallopava]|uniref:Major facilitator superfamily (MFS) profile domain-containing protein n=1 Tax=Verruconis gallopava TaxID=253628 RepID=A0A0D1Z6A0_9PEZI|nr:uncharacterized protein PV09_01374 [Verruconis gallopava]KIW08472.1 hypothetical protein PV09_01374 [Verruconis gallopava]